jgi:UV DNA damage endonuclease
VVVAGKGKRDMKLGYPCINRSLPFRANRTFRLASYTPDLFRDKVKQNLAGLQKILEWNVTKGLLYFRIGSEIIPFASHPICRVDWQKELATELTSLGELIRINKIRIAMHPDQFVLLNSPRIEVVNNSVAELNYHAEFLDAMNLDQTAKLQIHVGGVYGDKENSIGRFVEEYRKLPSKIKTRLVIENDDRLYSLKDCLTIHQKTGVPVLFDVFHHRLLNQGETETEAIKLASTTWKEVDGLLLVDYSSQEPGGRKGKHAKTVDLNDFSKFMRQVKDLDFDLMLEIKDKEKSALKIASM